MTPQEAAEQSISTLGCGFDLADDIHLSRYKRGPAGARLVQLGDDGTGDLVLPGGVVVRGVPSSVRCDKGERARFRSDVLPFHQMAEQFNRGLSLAGKIPSGMFNAAFDFRGCWLKDAAATMSLSFDGWVIALYSVVLERHNLELLDHVKQDVPPSWDPTALAGFIENYGTHVIVGVQMGGSDVIHIKQQYGSALLPHEVQNLLKALADERFSEGAHKGSSTDKRDELMKVFPFNLSFRTYAPLKKGKRNIVRIHVIRGGLDTNQSHNDWLSTVSEAPNVVSMSLVPITSLLNGVSGSGFLSHAINSYLRYKPPIKELKHFLEFQLPRKWAPAFNELPLRIQWKRDGFPSLKLGWMGPKISVNTIPVESGNCPVTGMRLNLEGKKNDCLAIHLQHLTGLPSFLQLSGDSFHDDDALQSSDHHVPIRWAPLSHVCTAPVQHSRIHIDELAHMVTKAWLEVRDIGRNKVLFLRLGFSALASAKIRNSQWEGQLVPTAQSLTPTPGPELNSAIFPGGPPVPAQAPRLFGVIDTTEMVRGPEEPPGYWIVTGAKLCVDDGCISLRIKYSLLTSISESV
ncbi:unnamed protein product [Spirodela intermedia]|uniref:MACPF domain-containing protein n=1 Tax=Spirodela intermedia TaxID=51605 RepID=A0A7I8J646_SPIIN|nr:unnamed protein product [Spirodela intermedia]CAA6665716.1 unnamed protein product [Spirodela intermedia]